MITTVLIYAIAFVALLQPNAPRLYASMVFVIFTVGHEWAFSDLDGLAYYGTAAIFDFLIILITWAIRPIPKLVINIHKICILSIIANAFGWVMWVLYLPPTAYNVAYTFIYAAALLAMIKKDGSDDRGFTLDSWRSCFRFSYSARASYNRFRKEKI